MQTAETPRPKRVTKRRAETRQRLLDAAGDVFAEEGFGRSTVEQVCERAGSPAAPSTRTSPRWTSCFSRCGSSARQPCSTASAPPSPTARRPSPSTRPSSVSWPRFRSTTPGTGSPPSSPRTPSATPPQTRHGGREDAILGTILPIVEDALAAAGRRVTDRAALGRALVAIHDGTAVQVLMEPENEAVRQARQRLFVTVVSSYSSGT